MADVQPPATGIGPDDTIVQSRPLAWWSFAVGFQGSYSNQLAGSDLGLALRAALGLKYVEVGAELPMRFVLSGPGTGDGSAGARTTGDPLRFWAKVALPWWLRPANGKGAGMAILVGLRLGDDRMDDQRMTLSPGLVLDHQGTREFLTSTWARVDVRLSDDRRPFWAQLALGAGASLPLVRSWGIRWWLGADATVPLTPLPDDLGKLRGGVGTGPQFRSRWGLYCNVGGRIGLDIGGSWDLGATLSCGMTPPAAREGQALVASMEPPADDPNAAPYDRCLQLVDGRKIAGPPQSGGAATKLCPTPTPDQIAELREKLRNASQALYQLRDRLGESERRGMHDQLFQAVAAIDRYEQLVGRGRLRASMAGTLGGAVAGLLADDATVAGVADDVLIPVVGLIGLITWLTTEGPAPTAELEQAWHAALVGAAAFAQSAHILLMARKSGNQCQAQYAADSAICAQLHSQPCWASAAERLAACIRGRPLMPLITW